MLDHWQFRKANSSEKWLKAKVPGTIHTDLFYNNQIPDPFKSCYYQGLKWVEESDWEYITHFNLPDKIDPAKPTELVFEGLDTYAEVFLNGASILKADNMFREWVIDCGKHLKNSDNELRIVFKSAVQEVIDQAARLPYRIPGEEHAYTRKSPYHFGWDWGPRMVTCGIWKPVYIRQQPESYIQSVWVKTLSIESKKAMLEAEIKFVAPEAKSYKVEIIDAESGKALFSEKTKLRKGFNLLVKPFAVSNPKIWWPNGLGSQHQYQLKVKLTDEKGVVCEQGQKVGIRTITLISEQDSIGQSFYFKVTGQPVFAKGANFVPPHSFLPSMTDSAWIALAEQARLANLNMLRIWGGGAYPPDVFMEACSERGIMIWQDFMFACSMSRWDVEYLDNIKQEATQQVNRLKRHTCLALWCGNNEVNEAWHNWGWQKLNESIPGANEAIWNGYLKVFHDILPAVVQSNDPGRSYWPSSPLHGWGRKESMTHGDSHYWGVWWGKEPFETYTRKVPRFMSEYGYQGSPALPTVMAFGRDGITKPDSLEMRCHQKHPVGYETIEVYMQREGFKPQSLENWVYLRQVTQAIGYRIAIEAHRLNMPRCMGTLYWQLNDCWPVVSWSGIDWYGRWKAAQYTVKECYKPILLSAGIENTRVKVQAASDYLSPVKGMLTLTLYTLNGNRIQTSDKEVTIGANGAYNVFNTDLTPKYIDTTNMFVHATLTLSTGEEFQSFHPGCKPGSMKLVNPEIESRVESQNGEQHVILKSKYPAFFVEVSAPDPDFRIEDNYFNMIPGREYRVKVLSKGIKSITVKSLWDYKE